MIIVRPLVVKVYHYTLDYAQVGNVSLAAYGPTSSCWSLAFLHPFRPSGPCKRQPPQRFDWTGLFSPTLSWTLET